MRVLVLGAPVVEVAGQLLQPARRAGRVLLGMLALRANTPVTIEWIIEGLWPGIPPKSAPANVRSHLADLRRLLPPDQSRIQIVATGGRYLLRAPTEGVDVTLFRQLLTDGRRCQAAGAHHAAAEQLGRANDLWRGPLLAGVALPDTLAVEASALEDQRVTAVEELVDARIALGRHDDLVPLLKGLVIEHRFRERLWGQLMLVLHDTGRTSEALDTYQRLAGVLYEELGTEPGAETTRLRDRIGRGARGPVPRGDAVPVRAVTAAPRQLPPDIEHFVGRVDGLAELDSLIGHGSAVGSPLGLVTGTAGVGKTALAVRWGHLRAPRFPDGQLYCDLYGAAPGAGLPAAAVLAGFLRALGVPVGQVPADQAEAAGMFRSVLAGRKVLVVLDNAGSAEQVRALRPAVPGCATLVTSRHRLSGLIARDDARRIELDPLAAAESTSLLARIVGHPRTAAEPAAAAQITARCGHLPLALRIAAARLCDEPTATLASFAGELAGARLAALAIGDDRQSGMHAAFELSYEAMRDTTRAVFRLAGLHPRAEFGFPAVAAMAGRTPAETRVALAELVDAHLVIEHGTGRYAMHDLLALYARERAEAELSERERTDAIGRGLEWYLRSARAAAELTHPQMVRLLLPGPAAPVPTPAAFASVDEAADWLRVESEAVLAAIATAADVGHDRYAWLLTDAMQGQFRNHLTLPQWRASVDAGLAAARRGGGDLATAAMLRNTGTLLLKTGDRAAALARYREANVCYARLDLPAELSALHNNIGMALAEDGRFVEAATEMRHGLAFAERTGNPTLVGTVLGNLAVLTDRHNLGWLADSVGYATRGLELADGGDPTALFHRLMTLSESLRAMGHDEEATRRAGEASAVAAAAAHLMISPAVLDRLASAAHADGRMDQALDYAARALVIVRQRHSASEETIVHNTLGWVLSDLGHRADAEDHFAKGLAVARRIDDPQATMYALMGLARTGPATEAGDRYRRALELATDRGIVEATIRLALARLAEGDGEHPTATAHIDRALRLSTRCDYHDGIVLAERLRSAGRGDVDRPDSG